MIKYVIFDMDGTLFNTEVLYREAWIRTSADWGLDNAESLYPSVVGNGEGNIIEIMKRVYGSDRDYQAFFKDRDVYYHKFIEDDIPLKDGCFEILEFLKQNGIKMALATSTRQDTAQSNLKRTGIYDFFDAIVTGDMVEHGKPAPDIFLKAGEFIGANREETAVCEDSFNGIRGAYAAKMKPIMVIDQLEPTQEIKQISYAIGNSLFDVIELIKKENNII